jgi:F0F1-type ATP synthase membrane subunit c/vacuolar-type H+-ATPase subunit K
MEHLGAGLAALGVIGPGIGIGILAGLSSSAIGRNRRRRPARDLHQGVARPEQSGRRP